MRREKKQNEPLAHVWNQWKKRKKKKKKGEQKSSPPPPPPPFFSFLFSFSPPPPPFHLFLKKKKKKYSLIPHMRSWPRSSAIFFFFFFFFFFPGLILFRSMTYICYVNKRLLATNAFSILSYRADGSPGPKKTVTSQSTHTDSNHALT